jgi:formylglycine-generating enzyme required for sulfatase activity
MQMARNRHRSVASLKPNDYGLFDMHGNVGEWCQDRFADYPRHLFGALREDNEETAKSMNTVPRVLRGGAYNILSEYIRSADRSGFPPINRLSLIGFRPARTHPIGASSRTVTAH